MGDDAARPYDGVGLPRGIRGRRIAGVNGLDMHVLEAGHEPTGRPVLLLLHGFPELAYSWRKVMLPLAAAGYHVIAPDQRGYGRTTGWQAAYDDDLVPFRLMNLARDVLGMLHALGIRSVAAVVGHDFGSSVAAQCALFRPDVFRAVAFMSAPFAGTPALPFGTADAGTVDPGYPVPPVYAIGDDLARLTPPRKHYHAYYATRQAEPDMLHAPGGVHAFLRAYFHMKSADWAGNRPYKLSGWVASELAKLPAYYVMGLGQTMPEAVAGAMPGPDAIAACRWLPEAELAVFAAEFGRTGFQGGLNWYRARLTPFLNADLEMLSGRAVEVPACFVSGASDWGIRQSPGALERMATTACARYLGTHLIEGAGHWVQQEQPEATVRHLLDFLAAAQA